MSRFNSVPVVIQQIVDSMLDKNTAPHVRHNQQMMVETIRDYCDQAIKKATKTHSK